MLDIDCSSKAMGPLGRYDGLALILCRNPLRPSIGEDARGRVWISYHSTDQPFAEYGIKDAATVQALGRVLENPQPFNVKRKDGFRLTY
jgi:hypothetical protein